VLCETFQLQLEEPFDILPLRQYSDGMYDAIDAIQNSYTPYVIGGVSAAATTK